MLYWCTFICLLLVIWYVHYKWYITVWSVHYSWYDMYTIYGILQCRIFITHYMVHICVIYYSAVCPLLIILYVHICVIYYSVVWLAPPIPHLYKLVSLYLLIKDSYQKKTRSSLIFLLWWRYGVMPPCTSGSNIVPAHFLRVWVFDI